MTAALVWLGAYALAAAAVGIPIAVAARTKRIEDANRDLGDERVTRSRASARAAGARFERATTGHQSLLTPGDLAAAEAQVDDVLFRMLNPAEVIAAMAFPATYIVLGTRREQVRMAGNAVTPPAARDLIAAVVEALGGAA